MERINPKTADITQENVERLIELFPTVATELINEDGESCRAIDLDALRELIGDAAEGPRERYQFTWPGKRAAKEEARRIIDKTLRPEQVRSVNWDDTKNIYIEGDNLEALKILRSTYAGKIKLIYIDPPYNTGHDFVYDDDFAQTRAEYDAESGDFDEEGGRLVVNLEGNGRFHSDWCSMMYPRLLLARDLLSSDGAIFISIDDGEAANLVKLCDEIFGHGNLLTDFIWEKRTTRENRRTVSVNHDHIYCYTKDSSLRDQAIGLLEMNDEALGRYSNPDNDPRGPWTSVSTTAQAGHATQSQFYEYTTPSGKRIQPSPGNCWRYTQKRMDELVADNRIWFGENGDNFPRYKKFLSEGRQGLTPFTIFASEDVGTTDNAKKELAGLFDGDAPFDTPKPVKLMKRILQIASNADSIVLDFFSGSATMAHAVMQKNAEDGGTRRFILVQIPEETTGEYANLCEIGEERIRRAGAKIVAEIEDANHQLKIGEEPKPIPDIGFRVLRIDSSNYNDTYATPDEYSQAQLDLFEDNVKTGRSNLDLLFQVLPDFRIPYSASIKEVEVCGKRAFVVNDGRKPQLVACFDTEVGTDCIEEIAKMEPYYAVFRDASMVNDATEANFEELFKTFSPDTVRRVI